MEEMKEQIIVSLCICGRTELEEDSPDKTYLMEVLNGISFLSMFGMEFFEQNLDNYNSLLSKYGIEVSKKSGDEK